MKYPFYCDIKTIIFLQTEQHFTEVVLGEEFLNLGIEQVCSLISSDKLTIASEEKVRQLFLILERLHNLQLN